jgi:hypothetical protein
MKPLSCEAMRTTHPSRAERILIWIPLIGWPFCGALQEERFRPIIAEIEGQLLARPETDQYWETCAGFEDLSRRLRGLIATEFHWPNDHFLPDDPFEIVFWDHGVSMDGIWTIQCIEEEFGIEISADDLMPLWQGGTLGDFVAIIASRISADT